MDTDALVTEALGAVSGASTADELDDARVRYLGRKSELKHALREVRDRESGMALNAARERIEAAVADRLAELEGGNTSGAHGRSPSDRRQGDSPSVQGRALLSP